MGFIRELLFTGEDPIYNDRARRYLVIAEDAAKQYSGDTHKLILKEVLTHAIASRKDSTNNEDRAMALALWNHVDSVYPGLLDIQKPEH